MNGEKADTARPALLKMNEAGNSFRKLLGGLVTKTQKLMYRVSNSKTMLNRQPEAGLPQLELLYFKIIILPAFMDIKPDSSDEGPTY